MSAQNARIAARHLYDQLEDLRPLVADVETLGDRIRPLRRQELAARFLELVESVIAVADALEIDLEDEE